MALAASRLGKNMAKKKTPEPSAPETNDPPPRRYTERLERKLTSAERLLAAATHVGSIEAIEAFELETRSIATDRKHSLRALETTEERLREIVKSGSEMADVECEERIDFRLGRKFRTRLDTGEVLGSDPLTDADRQARLPGMPAPEAPPPPAPPPPKGAQPRDDLLSEGDIVDEEEPPKRAKRGPKPKTLDEGDVL